LIPIEVERYASKLYAVASTRCNISPILQKVDFDEFTAAMTRLNFIGCQHEVEALFDRFDEDSSGSVGYLEFAANIFGLAKGNVCDP
jgi:hypothetical protein